VRNGGSALISETPEIYGAEYLLTACAACSEENGIGEREFVPWLRGAVM
jgi:hypothetical protein